MTTLSRRSLLRGLGGAALSLPLLEAMGCGRPADLGASSLAASSKQALGAPKRLVIMFTPNGSLIEHWRPTGGETDFVLQGILQPLQPFRDKLLLLDGIDYQSHNLDVNANMHDRGTGHLLTGCNMLPGPQGYAQFGHLYDGSAGSISADQMIANTIGTDTRFRSLQLGMDFRFDARQCFNVISYRAPFQPLPPENDPRFVFDRLFAPPPDDRVARRRRTVVDATLNEYKVLAKRLGTEDRRRMELHLSSLNQLETRLSSTTAMGAQCGARPAPVGTGLTEQQIASAQMDNLTAALACDLTRVVTVMWDSAAGNRTFPWLGINQAHHEISHAGDSDTDAQDELLRINRWYAEQMAEMLRRLAATPDGTGTLLDSTTVVWMNELSRGNNHGVFDAPIVMAGNLQGTFQTGRYKQFNGLVPHNDFLVSLMRAYGVDVMNFGNLACSNGPIDL